MNKKDYVEQMKKLGFNPDCKLYHHYEDMMSQKSARLVTLRDAKELLEGTQSFKKDLLL
jgi:hypothetical protein